MSRAKYFELSDHVCRFCLGRILHRGATAVRCADCGATADSMDRICACGVREKSGKPLGLKCVPNPNPSPAVPFEVIVGEASA
jgi:LSD1 subclass zinc finger protein